MKESSNIYSTTIYLYDYLIKYIPRILVIKYIYIYTYICIKSLDQTIIITVRQYFEINKQKK